MIFPFLGQWNGMMEMIKVWSSFTLGLVVEQPIHVHFHFLGWTIVSLRLFCDSNFSFILSHKIYFLAFFFFLVGGGGLVFGATKLCPCESNSRPKRCTYFKGSLIHQLSWPSGANLFSCWSTNNGHKYSSLRFSKCQSPWIWDEWWELGFQSQRKV